MTDLLRTPTITAGFNSLTEARGFKGSDENKSFSMEALFSREEGLAFVDMLQEKANKLHAKELERAKASGKSVRYALPVINYKEMDDGRIKLTFKRREADKQPPVVGPDNQPLNGFIRRDNAVQVAFRLRPYVMANVFGVTLQLLGVKLIDSVVAPASIEDLFGPAGETKKTAPAAEVNVNDLF